MTALFADVLGVAAAVCSTSSFAPQVIKTWREKDASAISLKTYLITVAGFVLWIGYGAAIGRWPIIASNAVCLALSGAVLVLKWRLDRRQADRPAAGA